VLDLIERKAAGEEIAVRPAEADEEPTPDLLAALEASLAEADGRGSAKRGSAKRGTRKTTQTKSTKTKRAKAGKSS
jgi:DNA end-binding protein Ku